MSKGKFSYTATNALAFFLKQRKNETNGALLRDIETELADYCELKRKSIVDIKRSINQPSLPVAMRMAAFFDVSVEELFSLKTKEELRMEKVERMKSLMQQLDTGILGELHEIMEEYLEEIEKDYPDIANDEESSTYQNIHQFYMNLPASGYIDDACGWLDNLQDKVEAEKK